MRQLIARTLEKVEDMDYDVLLEGVPWDFVTFAEYLDSVRRRGCVLNYAAYIGHTALRLYAMGEAAYDRVATPEEVAVMAEELRSAMEAGAAGFASSFAPPHNGADGRPVPSRVSDRAEVDALLEVMTQCGRGVVSVAPGGTLGIADLYEIQPRVGLPFTYGALLTNPAGTHRHLQAMNTKGWAAGAEVWPQVTPRPLAFAFTMDAPYLFNSAGPFMELGRQDLAARRAAYADPSWRALAFDALEGVVMRPSLGHLRDRRQRQPTRSRRHPHRRPGRGGRRRARSTSWPDLALAEPDLRLRVRGFVANDDTAELAGLLADEHCTLGLSDAGAHVGQLCDAPQATDFLGNWVRDRQLMSLEAGVRKLSGVQADLLGLPDRGYLRAGCVGRHRRVRSGHGGARAVAARADFPGGSERLTADQPSGIATSW